MDRAGGPAALRHVGPVEATPIIWPGAPADARPLQPARAGLLTAGADSERLFSRRGPQGVFIEIFTDDAEQTGRLYAALAEAIAELGVTDDDLCRAQQPPSPAPGRHAFLLRPALVQHAGRIVAHVKERLAPPCPAEPPPPAAHGPDDADELEALAAQLRAELERVRQQERELSAQVAERQAEARGIEGDLGELHSQIARIRADSAGSQTR